MIIGLHSHRLRRIRLTLYCAFFPLFALVGTGPAAAAKKSSPIPVLESNDAGPDLPPLGRSLFDTWILAQFDPAQGIPTPFSRLKVILDGISGNATGSLGLHIPMGRSLQRYAALEGLRLGDLPQADREAFLGLGRWRNLDLLTFPRYKNLGNYLLPFFLRPRSILTFDGDPPDFRPVLRSRLYIGYQENADTLEVISYNEAAARFEFQLVRNYSQPGRQRVLYASRKLCFSCHQNQAPIFSKPSWKETNADAGDGQNPVALWSEKILYAKYGDFYQGIPVKAPLSHAQRFDTATDISNTFSLTQKLWREVCREAGCKKAAIYLALAEKIVPEFDRNSDPVYQNKFIPALAAEWKKRWPAGLLLPNPDLEFRNPLEMLRTDALPSAPVNLELAYFLNRITPAQSPLAERARIPFAWEEEQQRSRLLGGIQEIFTVGDIEQISLQLNVFASFDATSVLASLESWIENIPTTPGSALGSEEPLQRGKILAALWAAKSLPYAQPAAPFDPPPPERAEASFEQVEISRGLQNPLELFLHKSTHCNSCHGGETHDGFVPNFLEAPTLESMRAQVTKCAARMFVRLHLWELPASERILSGVSVDAMPIDAPIGDPDIKSALIAFVAKELFLEKDSPGINALLEIHRAYESGNPILAQNLLRKINYEALPTCQR